MTTSYTGKMFCFVEEHTKKMEAKPQMNSTATAYYILQKVSDTSICSRCGCSHHAVGSRDKLRGSSIRLTELNLSTWQAQQSKPVVHRVISRASYLAGKLDIGVLPWIFQMWAVLQNCSDPQITWSAQTTTHTVQNNVISCVNGKLLKNLFPYTFEWISAGDFQTKNCPQHPLLPVSKRMSLLLTPFQPCTSVFTLNKWRRRSLFRIFLLLLGSI